MTAAPNLTVPQADRPLSILFIMPAYLPESYGGGEQQTRKMAAELARMGIRATILTPTTQDLPEHDVIDETPVVCIRCRHLPSLGGRYMPSFIHWWRQLTRWMEAHRDEYDIVHVIHGRLHAVPAVVAGHKLGKPTLIKNGRGGEHFEFKRMARRPLYGRTMQKLIVRSTTAYVANSVEIADNLAEMGIPSEAILRIPNGVEIPPEATEHRETGPVRCVYLGRLDPEKNLEMMIRAFARLPLGRSAELRIVGDGTSGAALKALAAELDEHGRISFVDPVTDVAAVYQQAEIFLSTSESEGMSNAMLEAMSHGLIPIVSNVSGVSDLIDDRVNGSLFEPGNEDDFLYRLSKMVTLPVAARRQIGLAARQRMIDDYGIGIVAQRHVEVYRQLLDAARV